MMLDTPGDEQISGQIVARKLSSGRIEFGWLPSGSDDADRVLPRTRFFPASPTVDKWLSSSSVAVAGSAIGHIEARRLHDGRTEFAFTPAEQIERIYPNVRYFPPDARVGRWLKSSEITFTPGPDDGGNEMNDGTDLQGGDELDTPTQPPPEPPTTTDGSDEDELEEPPTIADGFTTVSAAHLHTCGLRANGAIECWGSDANEGTSNGEPYVVRTGRTIAPAGSYSAVAAGLDHTCAIRANGTIACWGDDAHGQTSNIPAGRFTAISTDNLHTCALREDGAIRCWGANHEGQSDAPAGRFTAVSAGFWHSCGLRESGAIECWGYDYYGEISDIPTGTFRAISEGNNHTCAIRTSGAIECWGRNGDGQASPPPGSFSAVSTGSFHTCAIRTNGAIECWGANYYGERNAPPGTFRAVSAGFAHTCGVRESRAIECWGANSEWIDFGQADPPSSATTPPTTTQPTPEPPTTTAGYSAVSAGGAHTCAIRTSGAIACWGYNNSGQASPPAGTFTAVSTGIRHSCGLRESGAIECWGDNDDGQSSAPPGSYSAVSAGGSHSCGLRTNGAIECWGANDDGQSSAPPGSYSAVSAGIWHTCAIRTNDGEIECWGSSGIGIPPAGSFRAVSVAGGHNCGLRTNGAIECWGLDYAGQTDAPAGRFTTISAGFWRACAIRESGALECWGWDYGGQTDAPAGSFTAISAGPAITVPNVAGSDTHTCAIRTSGALECWGSDRHGQTDVPSAADGDGSEPERLTNFGEAEGEPMIHEGEDGDEMGGMSDDGDELGGMSEDGAGDQPTPEPRVGTSTTRLQRDASVTMDSFPIVPTSAESTAYGYIVARLSEDGRIEFGWQTPSGERVLPRARYFPQDPGHDRWLNSTPIEVAGTEIGQINVRRSGDGGAEFAFTPTDGERIEPTKSYFPPDAQVGIWLRTSRIILDDTWLIDPERLIFDEAEGEPMIHEGDGELAVEGDQPQRDASVTMVSSPIVPTSAGSTGHGYIVARLNEDGRVEFGWQLPSGERVLPEARYFPADPGHNRWLRSTTIEVADGRIEARRLSDGRIEFALTPTGWERSMRILPAVRYFPPDAQVGLWLRTSAIIGEAAGMGEGEFFPVFPE